MRRVFTGSVGLALALAAGCTLAGLGDLAWRGPDAGQGAAGADASSAGGESTGNCSDAGIWTAARLPERDGGQPPMTAVSAASVNNIWAVGQGGAIFYWDGAQWHDQSEGARQDGENTSFRVSDIASVSIGRSMVAFAGAYRGGATAQTACGWKYTDDPGSSFMSQSMCSGAAGFGWLASSQSGDDLVLAGEKGHLQLDNDTVLVDGTGADYRAAFLRSDGEVWLAGALGAVRYMSLEDTTSQSAKAAGFPPTSASTLFDAVLATDTELYVAGPGALYECGRTGPTMAPALSDCRNHAGGAQAIHGLARGPSGDLWAAGEESGSPALLRRTGSHAWQAVAPPCGAGALFGLWRGLELTVVAGAGGVFSSSAF